MKEPINNENANDRTAGQAKRLRTLIIFISAYFAIGLTLIFLFLPHIRDLLHEYLYSTNTHDRIAFFTVIISFTLLSAILLISLIYKYKDLTKSSSEVTLDTRTSDTIYFGKYSAERQYLEEKLNELTHRLTESDEKWARINRLVVSGSSRSRVPSSHLSTDAFLKDFGISLDEISVERRSAFMLTPNTSNFDRDYEVVANICRSCNIRITRGDEENLDYGSQNMLGHIVRAILTAGVVIANVSNRNPNVFYELGLAHMIGKPTILICARDQEVPAVPFDLLHRYIVFYSSPSELADKLRTELLKIYLNE